MKACGKLSVKIGEGFWLKLLVEGLVKGLDEGLGEGLGEGVEQPHVEGLSQC